MLTNPSMPPSTVIPVLPYPDVAAAVAWLTATFGFTLRLRIGDHRAQLNVGDGAMVVVQGSGRGQVMVRVEDVDRHHDHASKQGARVVQAPTDQPYGERQYSVEDLAGHAWTFSQSIAAVPPAQWGGTPGQL